MNVCETIHEIMAVLYASFESGSHEYECNLAPWHFEALKQELGDECRVQKEVTAFCETERIDLNPGLGVCVVRKSFPWCSVFTFHVKRRPKETE